MFSRIWEWFKAWRRGEKRIAPAPVRGRVYQKREEVRASGSEGVTVFGGRGKVTVQAKVIRADGTEEPLENLTLSVEEK